VNASEEELPLAGGLGSGGLVVRVGDTVRRPVVDQAPAIDAFLAHLADVGFEGAPVPLGRDEHGRIVLSWVDGDVALPPFPAWAADDNLLVSVAELQRLMHNAARSFVSPPDVRWYRPNLPPIGPDDIVCHNDLCIENVIVREGRAVAFIDFDFAAPADPLLDIAIACRHWVPLKDPADITDGFAGVDQHARFRSFCDAHGLDAERRSAVVAHALDFLDRALVTMKAKADSGLPMYQAVWNSGYPDQNRRSHAWLAAHLQGAPS
jgi:hypothetical protein